MSGSPEITETTFETVFKDKNGDDERIIRRVTTKVHDPRSNKVHKLNINLLSYCIDTKAMVM